MQAFSLSVSADYFTHMVKWSQEFRAKLAKNLSRDFFLFFFILSHGDAEMLALTPTVSNQIISAIEEVSEKT